MDFACLNESQVETNIKNIAYAMKLHEPKKTFDGTVKPKTEEVTMYGLSNIKKRASKYQLWTCDGQFYFIVIFDAKWSVQHFIGVDWFEHLLDENVVKGDIRPHVYICSAYTLTDSQFDSIPYPLIHVPYRLVELTKLHALTGSPKGFIGMASEYERLETKDKAFNNKEWSDVFSDDVSVIMLNALPGELIRARLIFYDHESVYPEYKIRRVAYTRKRMGQHNTDGLP